MPEKFSTIKPEQVKGEIQLEEVAELEVPIKKIIEKNKNRIENGEYGLIIGDDASGRIPALILGNFIKKVSEANGMKKPEIIFIPGKMKSFSIIPGRTPTIKRLTKHLSKYGASKEKRVLIVTDTIVTGNSLRTLVQLLYKSGYVCDIATVGVEEPDDPEHQKEREHNLIGVEIISGEYEGGGYGRHTPGVYKQKLLSGVYKRTGEEKSKRVKDKEVDVGAREAVQDYIEQGRKDSNIVVDHLIDWYGSRKQEKG